MAKKQSNSTADGDANTTEQTTTATAESLAENLGQLSLSSDGTTDTITDTTDKTTDTPQTRYTLRSRNKDTISKASRTQPETNSTGIKQATTQAYIPPHLRGKTIGKDISSISSTTTQQPITDNSKPSTQPRTRRCPIDKKSSNLNGNASNFQPQVANRVPPTPINFVPGTEFHQGPRPTSAPPLKKKDKPSNLHILKRPAPTQEYLKNANQAAQALEKPRQLLVVLDLNGTLLYRKPKGGSTFVARPKVNEFIHYLLSNHRVMVWSSARPDNVNPMVKKLFDEEQHQRLVAVWARDTLHIPSHAYNSKVQVYKQLSWIWKDQNVQAANLDTTAAWDQSNTVLIDDSVAKAASEPHNLICLEEFQDRDDQRESDVLGQVVKYLETLKYENNVSASTRVMPFTYSPGEEFDWRV